MYLISFIIFLQKHRNVSDHRSFFCASTHTNREANTSMSMSCKLYYKLNSFSKDSFKTIYSCDNSSLYKCLFKCKQCVEGGDTFKSTLKPISAAWVSDFQNKVAHVY